MRFVVRRVGDSPRYRIRVGLDDNERRAVRACLGGELRFRLPLGPAWIVVPAPGFAYTLSPSPLDAGWGRFRFVRSWRGEIQPAEGRELEDPLFIAEQIYGRVMESLEPALDSVGRLRAVHNLLPS
jgi:hypothetical protein